MPGKKTQTTVESVACSFPKRILKASIFKREKQAGGEKGKRKRGKAMVTLL